MTAGSCLLIYPTTIHLPRHRSRALTIHFPLILLMPSRRMTQLWRLATKTSRDRDTLPVGQAGKVGYLGRRHRAARKEPRRLVLHCARPKLYLAHADDCNCCLTARARLSLVGDNQRTCL